MCVAQTGMCPARPVSVQETTPPILHTSPVWNKPALWTGDTVEERPVSLVLLTAHMSPYRAAAHNIVYRMTAAA